VTRLITPGQRFSGSAAGISLRLVVLEDCTPRYLRWLEDPEVNRYLETRWSAQSLESIRAFVAAQLAAVDSYLFAIEAESEHVGNLKIGPINPHHGCADLSYFIGERASWGRGIATAAIRIASSIAFGPLGLYRLQAGVYASNLGSIRVLEKTGFRQEGVWRRQLLGLGGREDHVWFGLLAEEHQGRDRPKP
jgi:RimJ/RimL family protein N-acetyltransferase